MPSQPKKKTRLGSVLVRPRGKRQVLIIMDQDVIKSVKVAAVRTTSRCPTPWKSSTGLVKQEEARSSGK